MLLWGLLAAVALAAVCYALLSPQPTRGERDMLLPDGYTLDDYRVEEVTEVQCNVDADCVTPPEYMLRSSCPFTSICVENRCNVVCPTRLGDAGADGGASEPAVQQYTRADYDAKMNYLAHYDPVAEAKEDAEAQAAYEQAVKDWEAAVAAAKEAGTKEPAAPKPPVPRPKRIWPPQNTAMPLDGAILPWHRIVAYYGNFYAKGMGVLGEYPEEQMLEMFRKEIKKWEEADPNTPVMPAVDYIAITAQASAGKDGKYRARMPHDQIDKALGIAEKLNGIVILEVQAGFSDILTETKSFGDYLKHPKVHIALDPEFAMIHKDKRPGLVVGTVSAAEVNEVADLLAKIVRENNLPPKVLIVHRYTKAMLTNATAIKTHPEVQVVIDMDGWGPEAKKYSTYNSWIRPEPVQFTGFKLFYKNDTWGTGRLLTPGEVLKLTPSPSFIQYQ